MRLFKPASSEGGQKSCPPGRSPKSRVFENRQNTLGSLTFSKPSVSWGWGISSNWSFFRPHQFSDHTNSQTSPMLRPHQFVDLTNSQATPILRPHHRLQQQQHRSLYYILPCLLSYFLCVYNPRNLKTWQGVDF